MSFLSSRTRAAREGFGQPVLRKEDARLLVGAGCYSDDVNLAGQAYACFVRSPHAHARIRRIETAAALATPGVIVGSAREQRSPSSTRWPRPVSRSITTMTPKPESVT